MPSLHKLQERFAHALFSGEDSLITAAIAAGKLTPETRFAIYRNNVLVNYRNALRDTYPALVKLVGDDFFNACARRYSRETASTSGDLHDYGESFGEFLRHFEPAQSLPYLGDMARLEWAMHRAFHADDIRPLDASAFTAIDQSLWPTLHLIRHPAVTLVSSPYPVFRIWRLCMREEVDGGASVDLAHDGESVMISRRDFEVQIEAVTPATFRALSALIDGISLGDAIDLAMSDSPDFDLVGFLKNQILGGAFVGVRA